MRREQKIILATAAAMTIVFFLFFLKPVLTAQFEANRQNGQENIYTASETQEPKSDAYSGQTETQNDTRQDTEQEPEQESKQDAKQDTKQESEQKTKQDVKKDTKQDKSANNSKLRFRSERLLNEHYDKHGIDMGFASAEEYEEAAARVTTNPNALHKTEKEDGDDLYYIEETNEYVVVSTDGYIRTYFNPDAGIKYYNKK